MFINLKKKKLWVQRAIFSNFHYFIFSIILTFWYFSFSFSFFEFNNLHFFYGSNYNTFNNNFNIKYKKDYRFFKKNYISDFVLELLKQLCRRVIKNIKAIPFCRLFTFVILSSWLDFLGNLTFGTNTLTTTDEYFACCKQRHSLLINCFS